MQQFDSIDASPHAIFDMTRFRHRVKELGWVRKLYRVYRLIFRATHFDDDMLLSKNVAFLSDSKFIQARRKASEHLLTYEKCPDWRLSVELWAALNGSKLEGDFVQCGVETGYTARAVIEYTKIIESKNRKFFLFDTYEGVPANRVPEDEPAAFWCEYTDVYDFVVKKFEKFPNTQIVRGIVPDSLNSVVIDKVSYLSIDMNYSVPERAALEHFWDKLVPGAIVVLDDYAFLGRNRQKESADEFAKSRGVKVLALPTGQGLLIKNG